MKFGVFSAGRAIGPPPVIKAPVMRRVLPGLAAALLLAACGGDPEMRTQDISGSLPDLEFELERAPDEATVTEADYADRVVALYFGFTHCPDYCPLTMARVGAALDGIDDELAEDMRVLFVSVDPERDTPEQLAQYVSGFGEQFEGLRADRATLREVTKRYRTTFSHGEPDENGNYEVSHGTALYVFDRDGEVRLLAREDEPIDDLQHDLEALLRSG